MKPSPQRDALYEAFARFVRAADQRDALKPSALDAADAHDHPSNDQRIGEDAVA